MKKLTKQANGLYIKAEIKVDAYFSVTGEIWKGKPKNDESNLIGLGAIGQELLKYFPEIKPLVDLHLSDLDGIPMHAVKNGIYHLSNGFTNIPEVDFESTFSKVYRIPSEYINELKGLNEVFYTLKLHELGILKKWKNEAKKAIELYNKL